MLNRRNTYLHNILGRVNPNTGGCPCHCPSAIVWRWNCHRHHSERRGGNDLQLLISALRILSKSTYAATPNGDSNSGHVFRLAWFLDWLGSFSQEVLKTALILLFFHGYPSREGGEAGRAHIARSLIQDGCLRLHSVGRYDVVKHADTSSY